ncbi:MAG TPA: GGDEF domain-containing protein [Nitrospiria bacterium]|nr:GGDEF domain-containing protein [Nitrospiria bacterium]
MTYNLHMDKLPVRSGILSILFYLLIIVPWLIRYLEEGRFAQYPRELIPQFGLSVLIGTGVYVSLHYRRRCLRQQSEIERLAQTDPVTMLGHPRALEEALVKEIARARRMDRPLSCIFADLDDFKMINDRFGHAAGNAVLQTVGKTIQGIIRQGMDLAFRYGGDQFVVILPEAAKAQAYVIAQRLHQALSKLRPPVIPLKTVRAVLAVAQLRPYQKATDLLGLVDKATRLAKTRTKDFIIDAEELEKELGA